MKLCRYFSISLVGCCVVCAWAQTSEHNATWQADGAKVITNINARVIATNIPGASAISQVGTFLNNPVPPACAHPIPTLFPSYIQPGTVLDPNRILVGSESNFGALLATGAGEEGSFLSIDPSGPNTLTIPGNFAQGHSGGGWRLYSARILVRGSAHLSFSRMIRHAAGLAPTRRSSSFRYARNYFTF